MTTERAEPSRPSQCLLAVERHRDELDEMKPLRSTWRTWCSGLDISREVIDHRTVDDRMTVPARRINEIVHGTRAITPDTALPLARTFDRFRMNLQSRYDLDVAIARNSNEFDQITPVLSA